MNSFTVDVEDWFCSHNLQNVISFSQWDSLQSRVVKNTHELLKLLDKHHVQATFFVLGWVAEKHPALVRDIASMGHEIGTHGYAHQLLTDLDAGLFRKDVSLSIDVIRACTGISPAGYRAPAFSVTKKTLWALPVLKELGIRYDSSVYPFSYHPDYGLPGASLDVFEPVPGLYEVPMSCSTWWGVRVPCSGGAYFRFLPYKLFSNFAKRVIAAQRRFNFYIHPWELDEDMPKVNLPFTKKLRHYGNLRSTTKKIERLLTEFEFTSIQNILWQAG
jgi:polysaccharide deacetylase family protein (PEP-CTERM system associated)